MEATRSEPTSSGVIPAASAAAAPPLEPPGVRFVSQGLGVRDPTALQSRVRRSGQFPRSGRIEGDDRVERRVVPFDPLELGLQDLNGGQLPLSHPACELGCRQPAKTVFPLHAPILPRRVLNPAPDIRSWAVVAASLGGAAALHAMFRSSLEMVPFMLFHGANFISAWYGGLLPGLVCTVSGAAIVNVFFLDPRGAPTLSLPGVIATVVFVAIGVGFSILCHSRLRALRAADEASVVRENFLTVAAHELRTPLTTLQLRLQRLRSRFGASEEEDDLGAALRQILRMDGLIHQFLDAIRLQQARIELDRSAVDLGALARQVGDRLGPYALPALQVEAPAPVVGSWDPARLEHVIGHLLLRVQ